MTSTDEAPPDRAPERPPGRTRLTGRIRRLSNLFVVVMALGLVGGVYSAVAPGTGATAAAAQTTDVQEGKALFQEGCITCHGNNGVGVPGHGPSLVGTGSAAAEFQVGTGRMPLAGQSQQAQRKRPRYTPDQIDAIAAYVESLGGGPQLPPRDTNLRDGDLAEGGELFRLNCASCHNFAGKGGALSSGQYAPALSPASDRDIYAAMLTGPQNMPIFADSQLSPQQKKDIITYVQHLKNQPDPGGAGLGRLGPVPEGLVAFLVGIGLLLFVTLWIGVKS